MAEIDAVIAALKAVLTDVEQRPSVAHWQTRMVNRWINQLPGAWLWRWRHLKLRGDIDRQVRRDEFVGHLRATITYLENRRDEQQSSRGRSWLPRIRGKKPPLPADKRLLQ